MRRRRQIVSGLPNAIRNRYPNDHPGWTGKVFAGDRTRDSTRFGPQPLEQSHSRVSRVTLGVDGRDP